MAAEMQKCKLIQDIFWQLHILDSANIKTLSMKPFLEKIVCFITPCPVCYPWITYLPPYYTLYLQVVSQFLSDNNSHMPGIC